jgi:hypothetical protein
MTSNITYVVYDIVQLHFRNHYFEMEQNENLLNNLVDVHRNHNHPIHLKKSIFKFNHQILVLHFTLHDITG